MNKRNLTPVIMILILGCSNQQSNSVIKESDLDRMYTVVSEAATLQVLKNVDRPFEVTLDRQKILITDPAIASVVVYCQKPDKEKVLFYLLFENLRAPAYAISDDDLNVLLVNVGGTVLTRDDDYWSGVSREVQIFSGAIESDGPPFAAIASLELPSN